MAFCPDCGTAYTEDSTFCPNCGKKIEQAKKCARCGAVLTNNSVFCTSCGYGNTSKIDTNEPTLLGIILNKCSSIVQSVCSFFKSIDKKVYAKILGIAVSVAVVLILVNVVADILAIPTATEIDTTSNNFANGAYATEYGSWVYYIHNNHLYREKIDTGKKARNIEPEEFTNGSRNTVTFVRDSIYCYYSMDYVKISPNSKETWSLNCISDEMTWQTDGKYCYTYNNFDFEDSGIYRAKISDLCAEKLKGTLLLDAAITELYLHDDYLLFVSGFNMVNHEENPYYGTWIMRTNGNTLTQLLDFCPDNMVAWDDVIYYTDQDDILNSMDFSGNHIDCYEDICVGTGLNITEEYIFYVDYETDNIYRTDHNGKYFVLLNDSDCSDIIVLSDWIVYYDNDKSEHYIMRYNGSECRALNGR